jgi:hypothetical protein
MSEKENRIREKINLIKKRGNYEVDLGHAFQEKKSFGCRRLSQKTFKKS